jgi:hypothetical protein
MAEFLSPRQGKTVATQKQHSLTYGRKLEHFSSSRHHECSVFSNNSLNVSFVSNGLHITSEQISVILQDHKTVSHICGYAAQWEQCIVVSQAQWSSCVHYYHHNHIIIIIIVGVVVMLQAVVKRLLKFLKNTLSSFRSLSPIFNPT